jgi:hypothetical protein
VPVTAIFKLPRSLFAAASGAQRDLVHVDEVLTQRFKIDLRPIGLRVSVEDLHDFLDCSESILAGIVGLVAAPCIGILSDPLDPAQKTARSRRMDIDVIGATISQSTIQQPLDIGAVAYVTYVVNAHVVGIIRPHRDQPMTHNLRNDVRPLETLAGLGVKKDRTWCPIDATRPSEMIGTQQHGCADLGFCKAVSARCGVIDHPMM